MAITVQQLAGLVLEHINNMNIHSGSSGGGSGVGSEFLEDWNELASQIKSYLEDNELYADIIGTTQITTDNAWAKYLECINAVCTTLDADVANIVELKAQEITALIGNYVDINADTIFSEYIKANDIAAENLTVSQLFSMMGDFFTAIIDNLSTGNVNAFKITSDHLTIANAFITDAMIDSINANKITAGKIDTDVISVGSSDGSLSIADNTIQILDSEDVVRVQIGEDATGDYGIILRDSDGNVMWSPTGIKEDAIKTPIISNSSIKANANIDASKLNISSIADELYDNGMTVLKSSQISSGAGTLDVVLSQLTTWKSSQTELTSSLQTQLNAAAGKLAWVVSASDVASLQAGSTTLYNKLSSVENSTNSISSTVSELVTAYDELGQVVESKASSTRVEQLADAINAIVTDSAWDTYFTEDSNGFTISTSNSPVKLRMSNRGIDFVNTNTNTILGTWDGTNFHCGNLKVDLQEYLQMGNYKWVPANNGALILERM